MDSQPQALEQEQQEQLRFSELFRPGGEAVVHVDPSPLRQAVRVHLGKYAGVTQSVRKEI